MKIFTLFITLLFSATPFIVSEIYAGPHGKGSPPGWQKGEKKGMSANPPLGLEKQRQKKLKKQKERPSGWDKGQKEGWSSNIPPGQESKQNRDPRTKDWKVIKDRRPWLE